MNFCSTRSVSNKKNVFVVVVYLVKKLNKIIKYIFVIICSKSTKIVKLATIILFVLLASSSSVNAYQHNSNFPTYSYTVDAKISTFPICKTNSHLLHNKYESTLKISTLNSNLETNYNKKTIFNYLKQNNKIKNLVHNSPRKPFFNEIISSQNLALDTIKSKNLCLLYLINLEFSKKILSAFYLCLNNQTILSLQLITFFINQNKVSLSNFYKTSCDKRQRQKPKSVVITDSIISLNYKVGDKVFLTCDLKKYNLNTGNEGVIIFVTKKTNIISVEFIVGQALKPLHFRKKLNTLVSVFVKQD